jgi:RHS repeat-associated protein
VLFLRFTGKERDPETGLDYFGARYLTSAEGRFMSPDDFMKDSHVADPQSWNKYAYARNNPLRYIDPAGEKATESTTCTTDQDNHTTCQVNIQASIAVYATAGSNLTQDQLNAAAATMKDSIQGAWTGSFDQGGVTYNVSTTVNVQVAASEAAATQTGAQNVIGLSNGNATPTADSYVNGRSLFVAITGAGPDTGVWNINNLANGVAAHEFTHLLGVDDKSGMVLSNTQLLNNLAIPHHATPTDLRWGVQEATSAARIEPECN